jgi:3-hydroxy-9,10-secoandrosta-1,3,5(10)-triene-9,17-dione monooxygenase reductase component
MGLDTGAVEESKIYRRALGAFATGVAVIATAGPEGPSAITVNSFTSVSLRPRLVLWCLDDRSDRYDLFASAKLWSVNVLSTDQEEISARFARQGGHAADPSEMEEGPHGGPWLPGAIARLGCRTYETRTLGDHLVMVGEVLAYDARVGAGLTYFRGRYGVAPMPAG